MTTTPAAPPRVHAGCGHPCLTCGARPFDAIDALLIAFGGGVIFAVWILGGQ